MPIDFRSPTNGLCYLDPNQRSRACLVDGDAVDLHRENSLLEIDVILPKAQSVSQRYGVRSFYGCDVTSLEVVGDDTHACGSP